MSRVQVGWSFALAGAILIIIGVTDFQNYWGLFVVGSIPFIVFFHGLSNKCPRCNRWWASNYERSDLLDRWYESEDIDREDISRNRNGKIISTTQRTEQIRILCEEKRLYFKCRFCRWRWTITKVYRRK